MSAVHKLCSTKVNSDKMPSQIYSWSAVLSSVILYIVHVYTYMFSNYGITYHIANDWNDVLAFLLW